MSGCYFDWRQGGGRLQTDAVNSSIIPHILHFSFVYLFHTKKVLSQQCEVSEKYE